MEIDNDDFADAVKQLGDAEARRTENTLLGTDNAELWAQEFCRIFEGKVVGEEPLDVGTMITWVANAMQTALDVDKARRARTTAAFYSVPQEQLDAFVEGAGEGSGEDPTLGDLVIEEREQRRSE